MATKKTKDFVQNAIFNIQRKTAASEANRVTGAITAVSNSSVSREELSGKKLSGKNMFGNGRPSNS